MALLERPDDAAPEVELALGLLDVEDAMELENQARELSVRWVNTEIDHARSKEASSNASGGSGGDERRVHRWAQLALQPLDARGVDVDAPELRVLRLCGKVPEGSSPAAAEVQDALAGERPVVG